MSCSRSLSSAAQGPHRHGQEKPRQLVPPWLCPASWHRAGMPMHGGERDCARVPGMAGTAALRGGQPALPGMYIPRGLQALQRSQRCTSDLPGLGRRSAAGQRCRRCSGALPIRLGSCSQLSPDRAGQHAETSPSVSTVSLKNQQQPQLLVSYPLSSRNPPTNLSPRSTLRTGASWVLARWQPAVVSPSVFNMSTCCGHCGREELSVS